MLKILAGLVLCSVLMVFTFGQDSSWLPNDLDEISRKCNAELHLPSSFALDFGDNSQVNKTARNTVLLCRLKAVHMYKDGTGLDVQKWNLVFKPTKGEEKCERPVVPECISKFSGVTPEGEKIFQTVKCFIDNELEKIEMGCGY